MYKFHNAFASLRLNYTLLFKFLYSSFFFIESYRISILKITKNSILQILQIL